MAARSHFFPPSSMLPKRTAPATRSERRAAEKGTAHHAPSISDEAPRGKSNPGPTARLNVKINVDAQIAGFTWESDVGAIIPFVERESGAWFGLALVLQPGHLRFWVHMDPIALNVLTYV